MAPGLRPGAVALGIEVRPRGSDSRAAPSRGALIIGARACLPFITRRPPICNTMLCVTRRLKRGAPSFVWR